MPTTTETTPTMSEVRAPQISRDRMSRPSSSVPSKWVMVGPCAVALMSMAFGPGSGSRAANIAPKTIRKSQPAASQNPIGHFLRCPVVAASVAGSEPGSSASMPVSRASAGSDDTTCPWIDYQIEHVHGEVHQDICSRHDKDNSLHYKEIVVVNRLQRQQPDARQDKDLLDQECAADQAADVES